MQGGCIIADMPKHLVSFGLTFMALFMLVYAFMAVTDSLPEPISPAQSSLAVPITDTSAGEVAEAPVRIVATSISLDKTISNPNSTDVSVLDEALLKGAVRYPSSALLGVNGTALIFGHSSYLPIVRNQNFKAFDGVQNLKAGEIISVFSDTREYRYSVDMVRVADATQDVVQLPSNGKFLTLVTCDSFGTKSNRFIVTATLAGIYSI